MIENGRGRYKGGTALLNNSTNLHGQFEKFMRAARSGDTTTLTEIYSINKRILQSRAAFGSTCVHIAAENGRIATLEWLRDRGADFGAKTRPRNQTPMHFAAARGQTQTLMWLCEHTQALGCNLDAKDYRKRTAADLAKQYEFHESGRVLDNAKRVPMNKLHRSTQFGVLYNGDAGVGSNIGEKKTSNTGTVSTRSWETYTREMLIEGLSDLRALHEMELESRKEVEQQHFLEISTLKSDLVGVKAQISELKSLVEHLARKDRAQINLDLQAKLEMSNRSKYLNGLTIGGVRVETEHISSTMQGMDSEVGEEEREGKGGDEEEEEEEEEEEGVEEKKEGLGEGVAEVEEETKENEESIPSRPQTSQSIKDLEGGWGVGLDDEENKAGTWSAENAEDATSSDGVHDGSRSSDGGRSSNDSKK